MGDNLEFDIGDLVTRQSHNNDGKVIRLAFPELNEERRKELVKEIKKISEDAKVGIREKEKSSKNSFKNFY